MPRCANCGKVNKDGSLFCQDCGQKLEQPVAGKRAPSGAVPALDGPTCSACGAINPPGMNFCKMCGTSLSVAARSAPTPTPMAAVPVAAAAAGSGGAKLTCSACGRLTPSGFAFCQHCGQKVTAPAAAPAPRAPTGAEQAIAPTMAVTPTPPGGMMRMPAKPAGPAMAATMAAPAPSAVVAVPQPAVASPPARAVSAPAAAAAAVAIKTTPVAAPVSYSTEPGKTVHGRLVAVRRDGSDGDSLALTGDSVDVGRVEGSMTFGDDPYLAPRHARFTFAAGLVHVRALDAVNGVFVRVRGSCDLVPGDHILVGKELLRFEALAAEERDPPSLVEHGVRIFGTVQREAWGRLRQLTMAGTTRDVWHLVRPELVLGREEGDVTFPDDEYLSRRHATVRRAAAGQKTARLEDMGSSNGTFIRIRGEIELKAGDVLRLGDQLLRLEG